MALPYDSAPKFQDYAHPEMIVPTEGVKLDWHTELNDPVTRGDSP